MTWIKAITPQQMNDFAHIYHGQWMPEMDRCWIRTEDGVCVCSRLIRTKIGKVEHVTITRGSKNGLVRNDGSGDFSWAEKQKIKNELFGENRCAVEVFPEKNNLVDTADVYHLWVFDKKYMMPFGIHPKQYQPSIRRGALKLTEKEIEELQKFYRGREVCNG